MWVFLGRAYLSGAALVSSVILARLMTLEEMGTYRLVHSGISLVAVLALPGAFEVLIRYIPRGNWWIYSHLFALRVKVGVLSVIGFAGFCALAFDSLTLAELSSLAMIAVMLPIYFSSQLYEAGYQAQMKFRELSLIYVGRSTLYFLVYLGSFLLFGSVFYAIAVLITVMGAYHFWNHLRIQRAMSEPFDTSDVSVSVVNREAVMISIFTVLPSLMENVDKILVERSGGLETLAIYSVGMTLGLAINATFKPFLTSINARLVHRTPKLAHYAIVVSSGIVIGGLLSVVVPYLVPLMYGQSYTDSVPITIVVNASMGLFFWKTLYFNFSMFNKERQLNAVYVSNVVMASGTIVYMLAVVVFVEKPDRLVLAMALAYPLKMILSISSLWIVGRICR